MYCIGAKVIEFIHFHTKVLNDILMWNGILGHQLITKKELLTIDPDTDDGQLTYEITTEAKHGFLESKLNPGKPITSFTQGITDTFQAKSTLWGSSYSVTKPPKE